MTSSIYKPSKHFVSRLTAVIAVFGLGLTACASQPSAPEAGPQISVTYYPTDAPAPPPPEPTTELRPTPEPEASLVFVSNAPESPPGQPPPEPTPAPPSFPLPGPTALLTGIRHERQTWNNCGPATISMLLSHFGRTETQREAAVFLKPDRDDKNVSPDELVAYAQSLGYGARMIVGGDLNMIRTLVANGLPVIVETWFIPDPNDEMGHYQLVIGYDEDELVFYDSYEGPNLHETIQHFEPLWKVFNRTAVVVWTPELEPLVQAILGKRADERVMYERALAQAQAEVTANPQDKFAWFNVGTNSLALGNSAEAANAFDAARKLKLPWRMMWYQFGPYVAYFEQGRHDSVIELATATLRRVRNLEESLYWRGRAYAATGNPTAARADFEAALRFNPNYVEARDALHTMGATR